MFNTDSTKVRAARCGIFLALLLAGSAEQTHAAVYYDDFASSANASWWSDSLGSGPGRVVRNPRTLRGKLAYEVVTEDFDFSYLLFKEARPSVSEAWNLSVDVTLPSGADTFVRDGDVIVSEVTVRPLGDPGDNELNLFFLRIAPGGNRVNRAGIFYRKGGELVELSDDIVAVDEQSIEVKLSWDPVVQQLVASFSGPEGRFELGRFDLNASQFDWGLGTDDRFEFKLGFLAIKESSFGRNIAMAVLNNRTMTYDNFRLEIQEVKEPEPFVSNARFHPADLDFDWSISITEVTSYGGAWKNGEPWNGQLIGIDYVTNAGRIWQGGGRYSDHGGAEPAAWSN